MSLALVLLVLASSSTSQPAPNVLILLVDDLGVGDLGCYGNISLLTPNMDSLARCRPVLTQAYTIVIAALGRGPGLLYCTVLYCILLYCTVLYCTVM